MVLTKIYATYRNRFPSLTGSIVPPSCGRAVRELRVVAATLDDGTVSISSRVGINKPWNAPNVTAAAPPGKGGRGEIIGPDASHSTHHGYPGKNYCNGSEKMMAGAAFLARYRPRIEHPPPEVARAVLAWNTFRGYAHFYGFGVAKSIMWVKHAWEVGFWVIGENELLLNFWWMSPICLTNFSYVSIYFHRFFALSWNANAMWINDHWIILFQLVFRIFQILFLHAL